MRLLDFTFNAFAASLVFGFVQPLQAGKYFVLVYHLLFRGVRPAFEQRNSDRHLANCAAHIRFCVENNDELAECRRFRQIPPLNADCAKDATDCVKLECQESEVSLRCHQQSRCLWPSHPFLMHPLF